MYDRVRCNNGLNDCLLSVPHYDGERNFQLVNAKSYVMYKYPDQVPQDILTKIIHTTNKLEGVTIRDLQDEFSTLFMAGQETTAASLAFVIKSVGKRQDILVKYGFPYLYCHGSSISFQIRL